ncbi:Elongation factor 1-gamma [Mortierella sp. AD032]|nr:Elongation factor 1-gamma [Mortierella sp. AD032]
MTVGTIYSYPQNPRVFKALVVAKYNGLEVKVDDKFVMGTTNKTDAWIAKFGASQVPAFEGVDGTIIIESGAIAYYLAHLKADSTLIGRSNAEEAHIQQWVQFVDCSLTSALSAWIYPILGYSPYNKASETAAIERTRSNLATLERHLIKKTYLVGERVTLADISSAAALFGGFKMVFDADFRKEFPAVTRWFTTIVNQPHFKAVAGETVLCEVQAKFTPPKKDTKEKKPKEEKPKEEKKPKAKEYSNNDTPVAMKWLWENIDLTTDFSFWKVDYKYNDELTKLYMSNNLAGGLMNRLERARKYAFGCLVVAGEDNANVITGYFIVRGVDDEMIEEITDAADYDSYNWTKVTVTDEEKKKIDQVFAWEGTIDGKPIADGKAFK